VLFLKFFVPVRNGGAGSGVTYNGNGKSWLEKSRIDQTPQTTEARGE
jgi:hypothetical protein